MNSDNEVQTEDSSSDSLHSRLASVLDVMALFSNRLPGDHIRIDLKTGEITNLADSVSRLTNR